MSKRISFRMLAGSLMIFILSFSLAKTVFAQPSGFDALDHYVGTWDVEMTIDPLSENKQTKSFRGEVEAKWTVGNRFLEQTGRYRLSEDEDTEPLVIKTLMTYDSKGEKYRYWYFISSGEVRESEGQWNEQNKTMASKMKSENGDATTITADFSKEGEENWVIETRQREDNSLVIRIHGTNRQRK